MTERIIGACIEVHRCLGPGLLESTYESCLAHELQLLGLDVLRQVVVPVHYKGTHLECGYRADLVIENSALVELKSVETLLPIHSAQVVTYLKLAPFEVGLLVNFNVRRLKDGLRRLTPNQLSPPPLPPSL